METPERSQARRSHGWEQRGGVDSDLIVPNPKLKLLDQVREVMRLEIAVKRSVNEIVMFLPNPLVPPGWAEGKRDDLQCSI
jgi:hypothetical protein